MSIVNLVGELSRATTVGAKKKLSRQLSVELAQDENYSILTLQNVAYGLMKESGLLSPLVDDEFLKLRHAPYEDVDGVTRVAIGVAFIQDYLNPDPALTERVAKELLVLVAAANLTLVVNDITVNDLQFRNGEAAHEPQEGA